MYVHGVLWPERAKLRLAINSVAIKQTKLASFTCKLQSALGGKVIVSSALAMNMLDAAIGGPV